VPEQDDGPEEEDERDERRAGPEGVPDASAEGGAERAGY